MFNDTHVNGELNQQFVWLFIIFEVLNGQISTNFIIQMYTAQNNWCKLVRTPLLVWI